MPKETAASRVAEVIEAEPASAVPEVLTEPQVGGSFLRCPVTGALTPNKPTQE